MSDPGPVCTSPTEDRLPDGFGVELAVDTQVSRNGRLLFGGVPPRLLRVNLSAAELLAARSLVVADGRSAALARKLVDTGIAHPRPPQSAVGKSTVVIPVRDRSAMLARLLATLRADPCTARVRVVVVDDGSRDAEATRVVAEQNDADLIRRDTSWGPAAARNAGLHAATTEFVVFCDSDVVPEPGWLPPLLAHFADPAVALAAPRIVAVRRNSTRSIDVFEEHCSPLDLGPREAPIIPVSKVAYVPSAAIVLRREAAPAGFADDLRVAEDVDLCLRLCEAGWRLRYVPSSRVAHEHRTDLMRWSAQRAFYGSGAAILARRHPAQVPPMHVAAWSLVAVCLLLTGRRGPATAATALATASAARLVRKMPDADTPVRAALRLTFAGLGSTAMQLVHAAVRHHWPLTALIAARSRRVRYLVLVASTLDALHERRNAGSKLNPLTFVLLRRLDDLSYGAGVWWGAVKQRTVSPLLPRISGLRRVTLRPRRR